MRRTAIGATALLVCGCAAPSGQALRRHAEPLPPELGRAPPDAPVAQVDMPTAERDGDASGPRDEQFRTVSLVEVLRTARERAAVVLQAAARLDAQAGRRLEAIGMLVPRAGAAGRIRHLSGQEVGSLGVIRDDLSFTELEAGVGLSWRFNPGAAAARIAASADALETAEHRVGEAQRRAMLAAGVAYHELRLARAALDIAERREADAESFRDIAQSRATAGVSSEADVQRAEVELAQARRNAIDARQSWQQSSIALATLLRWDAAMRLVPIERNVRPRTMVDYTAADRLAEQASARPDLQAAEASAEAARGESTAAWWALLGPEVNASATGTSIGLIGESDMGPRLVGQVLLGWSIGLDEVGRVRAAEHTARARAIAAEYKSESVRAEIRAAADRAQRRAEAIEQARNAARAAERNRNIQRARFENGTALGLEVIEAQKTLARTRLALVQAIVRYDIEQVRLLASVGHLSPDAVQKQ